jgi:cysteine dioxygenase
MQIMLPHYSIDASRPSPRVGPRRGTLSLAALCEHLDAAGGVPCLETIEDWLRHLSPSPEELRPYLQFKQDTYSRNLIQRRATYEVLLLCWRPGQHSPIHDHAGSQCALIVLAGKGTEVRFEREQRGRLQAVSYQPLPTGTVTASVADDLHVLGNWTNPPRNLVSLHVYSPPLDGMKTYPDGSVTPTASIRRLPAPQQRNLNVCGMGRLPALEVRHGQ